jgi:hypothetical protein
MSVSTPYIPAGADGELLIWSSATTNGRDLPESEASTPRLPKLFNLFGSFAAPIMVLASFISPMPEIRRRDFFTAGTSSSAPIMMDWAADELWTFTQARTTQAEIDALNELLNLELTEGIHVRLVDDD